MSRRSRSVRRAMLTVALVCGLGGAFGLARAQVPEADVVSADPGDEVTSPWSFGLLTSTIALTIGGVSAVLGIWVHRDDERPVVNAVAMSALVVSAVSVGLTQGYMDAIGAIRHTEDLERMIGMVDEIALASDDPALAELVRSERAVAEAAVAPSSGP